MNLTIKNTGGFFIKITMPEYASISDLKREIERRLNVDFILQTIVFKGKILHDSMILSHCGVTEKTPLYLAVSKLPQLAHSQNDTCYQDEGYEASYIEEFVQSEETMNFLKGHPSLLSVHELSDFLKDNCMTQSPAQLQEMNRLTDCMMNNCESTPSGFAELVSNFIEYEEYDFDNIYNVIHPIPNQQLFPTIIGPPAKGPSTSPLPFCFSRQNQQLDEYDQAQFISQNDMMCDTQDSPFYRNYCLPHQNGNNYRELHQNPPPKK